MSEWDVRPPGSSWIDVRFPDAGNVVVHAEVAKNTERGLMGRVALSEDQGMFFDMVASRDHAFYMKDVPIALDMIFISADHVVVGILRNVPPMTSTLRTIGAPSRYVLEVVGGWCLRHGVEVGTRVE